VSGHKYYLVILDDCSHYLWTFPLRLKSDTLSTLTNFFAYVRTLFGVTIQGIQCDNGREFDNLQARNFSSSHGVHLRMSCPYTSAQNGKVERVIRSINNIIRTLIQSSVPPSFWAAALGTATYLLNIIPTKTLALSTPHFALFGHNPSYEHLRVFGCKCYPNLSAATPHKLSPRSTLCVFLGYSPHHKGYLCFDRQSNRTIISRHVVFDETSFPFSEDSNPPTPAAFDFLDDHSNPVTAPFGLSPVSSFSGTRMALPPPPVASSPVVPSAPSEATFQPPTALAGSIGPSSGLVPPSAPVLQFPDRMAGLPGASSMEPGPPGPPAVPDVHGTTTPADRFCGRVYSRRPPTATAPAPPPMTATTPPIPAGAVPVDPVVNHHRMTTHGKSGLRFPALFKASALSPIPRTYRATLTDPNWRSAMEQEYSALIGNHTWDLLPRPPHCNVVTGKWVFKHKFKADGSLERYKARWVLRGFTQRPGIDFSETFSPVVKPTTVRTVLSLALSHRWPIHQLDVNNAFLQGTLSETVHCVQPTGFEDSTHPDYVCRLNRSLYGLKQAPRAWYSRFASHLIQLEFVEAMSDTSLFVYHKGADMIYLLLYVDDIVLTASSMPLLRRTITAHQQEFSLKDLGPLHHFLGMHVQQSASGITLSASI
jgi:hypothetical protein